MVREAQDAGRPDLLHFDGAQALIVVENLGRHVIWRRALIERQRHETAAPVLGQFMAETPFRSSDLALKADAKKREMALFAGNTSLCKVTEDLVFTDPYTDHEPNDFTPELSDSVARIHADTEWKVATQGLKWTFLTRTEALVHGDLHTGSVMVPPPGPDEDVRVIDSELTFYGPMGFGIPARLANRTPPRRMAGAWARTTRGTGFFARHFASGRRSKSASRSSGGRNGRATLRRSTCSTFPEAGLAPVLRQVGEDALGFAGAKTARRILGLAGATDLGQTEDTALRARRALRLARRLIVERREIATVARAAEIAAETLGRDA